MKSIFHPPIEPGRYNGIPINYHPGAFGFKRKYNYHEGVDLYCEKGTEVRAVSEGTVVLVANFTGPSEGHDWWLPTQAVTVDHGDFYIVYGEIVPRPWLRAGIKMLAGDLVGTVTPVLKPEKLRPDIAGHSVSMLHIEMWDKSYDPEKGWHAWNDELGKPSYLKDVTPLLIRAYSHVEVIKYLTDYNPANREKR